MDKGYYLYTGGGEEPAVIVAIHNKNGQGLLPETVPQLLHYSKSQSTIKMDKGYYLRIQHLVKKQVVYSCVAIHNKNGQGLLLLYLLLH